jgi:ribonuclease P protein component
MAQMNRIYRLRRSIDIKRVRRSGKSYAHPLVVLYVHDSSEEGSHFGVSAGLAIGNAVKRNRAKRLLRAAIHDLIPFTLPGADLLFVARPPLINSNYQQVRETLFLLVRRAGLLVNHDG